MYIVCSRVYLAKEKQFVKTKQNLKWKGTGKYSVYKEKCNSFFLFTEDMKYFSKFV